MPNWEAFQEADKRGILTPDKKVLYQEAIKRGLVPAFQGGQPKTLPGRVIQPGMSEQQAFFERMRPRFEDPQKPLLDPNSFAEPSGWQKTAGVGLPIAGDIAMTFAAPQAQGPRLAGKLGNLLMRGLSSAEGSYAGSFVGQQIEKGGVDTQEAGKEAALGFGGELALGLLGGPIKWVAKKVTRPMMELMSDITFSGSAVKEKLRNNLIARTSKRAIDFIEKAAPDIVKKQDVDVRDLGVMVESALDETRLMFSIYEDALEKHAVKNNGLIALDDTSQFLGDLKETLRTKITKMRKTGSSPSEFVVNNRVLKELGYTPQTGFELQKLLEDDLANPKQVKYLLATVFKSGKKGYERLTPSVQNLREELKEVMKNDLNRITETSGGKSALAAKEEADEVFKTVKQFQFIKNLFDRSIRELDTGKRELRPYKLYREIYENKKSIQKQMPELWPKLKAEADYHKKIAPEFSAQERRLIGGAGAAVSRGIGGAMGTLLLGPTGIPIMEGVGAINAFALMSPKAQKIIGAIISQSTKSLSKTGLHLGGKQINFSERGE